MNRKLIVILVLSVALRLAAVVYMGTEVRPLPGTADQVTYHTLAQRVLDGQGFTFDRNWWPSTRAGEPTAHWSYLYTFYLVGVYAIFSPQAMVARAIQAVAVGILQPLLAFRIGANVFDEITGLIFASLTAVYIYFIYYAAALMTEPFYITAILGGLYLAVRLGARLAQAGKTEHKGWLSLSLKLGAVLGVAILLRQLLLIIVPFIFAWLWLKGGKRSIFPSVTILGLIAIMILPFTLFNYLRFNRFVLLNTNAGFAFFWANHPIYGTRFEPILPAEMGSYQDLIPDELRGLDEAALDQELLRRGIGFVVDDPIRYLRLSVSRIPAYFKFWPSSESSRISNISRVASFGLFMPFMIWGLFLSYAKRLARSQIMLEDLDLLTGFAMIYTVIHLLSWSLIRYRLPVDAVLLLFAAYALKILYTRVAIPNLSLERDPI